MVEVGIEDANAVVGNLNVLYNYYRAKDPKIFLFKKNN